jgi:hypothetical protein
VPRGAREQASPGGRPTLTVRRSGQFIGVTGHLDPLAALRTTARSVRVRPEGGYELAAGAVRLFVLERGFRGGLMADAWAGLQPAVERLAARAGCAVVREGAWPAALPAPATPHAACPPPPRTTPPCWRGRGRATGASCSAARASSPPG